MCSTVNVWVNLSFAHLQTYSALMFGLQGLQYVSVTIHVPHRCEDEHYCHMERPPTVHLYQLFVCRHSGHCLKLSEQMMQSVTLRSLRLLSAVSISRPAWWF